MKRNYLLKAILRIPLKVKENNTIAKYEKSLKKYSTTYGAFSLGAFGQEIKKNTRDLNFNNSLITSVIFNLIL